MIFFLFFSRKTIVYCHNTTKWTPTWWGTTRPSLLENASGSMILVKSTQLPGGLRCLVRECNLESDNPGHSEGNKNSKCFKNQDIWIWVLTLTSTVRSWVIWNLSVLPKYSGSEALFLFLFPLLSLPFPPWMIHSQTMKWDWRGSEVRRIIGPLKMSHLNSQNLWVYYFIMW